MIGHRLLDESFPGAVRRQVGLLTATRATQNAAYRYAAPFLATIAAGLGVSLTTIGVAIAITELSGLASPFLGRLVDRRPRRGSMLTGASLVALSALAAAASPGIVALAVALFVLAMSKMVYDLALNAWVADHVDYARRGRVVGIVEASWAGGLLLGVPVLGVLTALAGWRAAYAAVAVAVAAMVVRLSRRLDAGPRRATTGPAPHRPLPAGSLARLGAAAGAMFFLMGAAQAAFVTFGSWLEHDHGFTAATLSVVTVVLGAGELLASASTVRLTDRLGKRLAVAAGATVMVPTGLALALGLRDRALIGLTLLVVFVIGFEFAIVSSLSLSSQLIPGRPGTGLGVTYGTGTIGRAVVALAATRLYDASGFGASILLASVLAAACVAVLAASPQLGRV